ncbi:MAG: site-specific integrase, partial [Solirubrobacterales bacterium]|nr:site-specific integrase [Solirubrobacterales bacterium]
MSAAWNNGHLTVEDRRTGRVYVARYLTATGRPTRKVLGEAWVRDNGRRTARGAVIWRAADGPCPDGHLTPKAARAALDELLARERGMPQTSARHHARTVGDAVDAWLVHREFERRLKPSTLISYRNDAQRYMLGPLGAATPLRKLTEARVERLQSELLISGLSLRTVQKAMVLLHGVLELAKRRGWIGANPCANLERIKVKQRRDLIVLTPDEIFLVGGAAARTQTPIVKDRRELYSALIVFSA